MKILKKSLAALSAAAVAAGSFGTFAASAAESTSAAAKSAKATKTADITEMRDLTTAEVVRDMGLGINLGNTFESCGSYINSSAVKNYETGWGSPEITQEMIQGYADEGFGSLRIPVAWSNMMGDDYTINSDYMARVKEVTEWALDAGLYVIVNIHWDGGWWSNFPTDKTESMYRYKRMWKQICDGFGEYGDHLIFESLNEEGGWSSMNTDDSYALLNEVNQTFVDLVRASGGNNAKRHLLIAGYETNIDKTCDSRFKMPTDLENRCAVSVHYYTPADFCIADDSTTWTTPRLTWGTTADYIELNQQMDLLKTTFVDKGIPVIVGEYGATTKVTNKQISEVYKFLEAACEAMYSRGMCPVLWDINYTEDVKLSVYNRKEAKLNDEDFKKALAEILAEDVKNENSVTVDSSSYTLEYKGSAVTAKASSKSGGAVKFVSSNEKVATVDDNGNITPVNAGTATITVYAEGSDEYLPATADITVEVTKLENPPVSPDASMTVENSVTSTSQIELPEGWKWVKTTNLAEGETTTVKAIYEDTNYKNRTISVEIFRKTADDSSSQPSGDSSSTGDSSSGSNSSSSSSSSNSSSNSTSSTSTTSSKTTTSTTTSTASTSSNADKATATGVGGGLSGIAGVTLIAGAAMIVTKKKGE